MKRNASILVLIAIGLFSAGCPSLARTAYTTAVGAKAFTDSMRKAHPECFTVTSSAVTRTCGLLAQAIAAKDILIDAGEVYCSGGNFETGGACNPSSGQAGQIAADKLRAAINLYEQSEKDVKGAVGQ